MRMALSLLVSLGVWQSGQAYSQHDICSQSRCKVVHGVPVGAARCTTTTKETQEVTLALHQYMAAVPCTNDIILLIRNSRIMSLYILHRSHSGHHPSNFQPAFCCRGQLATSYAGNVVISGKTLLLLQYQQKETPQSYGQPLPRDSIPESGMLIL